MEAIVEAISTMDDEGLRHVQEAMGRRRRKLEQSSVLERRAYGTGLLQLEYRANPKTGTRRGPYSG